MNRRNFTQAMAAAALAATAPRVSAAPGTPASFAGAADASSASFQFSVMLWTVFHDLPFEQRLEKVAEAGFTNIELVGEYAKWTADDFAKANAARKRLGIHFDATAGLGHGVGDPSVREALLSQFKAALTPMETLGCPAMIVLSGNVVPG